MAKLPQQLKVEVEDVESNGHYPQHLDIAAKASASYTFEPQPQQLAELVRHGHEYLTLNSCL